MPLSWQLSWESNPAFWNFNSSISSVRAAICSPSLLARMKWIPQFFCSAISSFFSAVLALNSALTFLYSASISAKRFFWEVTASCWEVFTINWYWRKIMLSRRVSNAEARAGIFSLTAFISFCTCFFSSRRSLLSALIWRFSSQRSETIPMDSSFLAWYPSCTVGCSVSPLAAWLRQSTRSAIPWRSCSSLTIISQLLRHANICSSLFQSAVSGFCLP